MFALLILLQSCSDSLPPRLAVDVFMAGPALSLVEQEAGRLRLRDPQRLDPAADRRQQCAQPISTALQP